MTDMNEIIFMTCISVIGIVLAIVILRAILSIPKILKLLTAQTKIAAKNAIMDGCDGKEIANILKEAEITILENN